MLPSVLAMSLCLVPQLTTRPHQVAVPAATLRLAAAPRAALTEEEISREKERRRLAAEGKGEVAEASAAAFFKFCSFSLSSASWSGYSA